MGERTEGIFRAVSRFGLVALVAAAAPGRVGLGQFGGWGAFRDAAPARCFAIAQPISGGRGQAALAVSTWPGLRARDQLHVRFSRVVRSDAMLELAGARYPLRSRGDDAWATTPRDDARIVAAMRGAGSLQVKAIDLRGRRFRDRYRLDGVASAIDAMRLGCLPG